MVTQAEVELDRFFTLSIDLLCIAGYDGYFKRLSPAWEKTLGYSTEEMLAHPFLYFVHPDDREATAHAADNVARGEQAIAFENRYRCKDGGYRWLSWNATMQPDRQLIYAVAHDVTRRRQNEQRVRDIQTFLDSIVENIPLMVFVKDARDFRFILHNRAGEELLGRPRSELMGRNDYDFFSKEEADFFVAKDRAVIESGKLLDIPEEPVETPRGIRYLHTKKIPIFDQSGKPHYLLGISEDITERKEADEQLRRQNQMLAELARSEKESSDKLKQAQSQMIQTEKLAALGQLVAGVAHEINNPLAFVSNNVAVMQREFAAMRELLELYQKLDSDPEARAKIAELSERVDLPYVLQNLPEMLNRSRDGLKRIQQIVSDLREFSRQEAIGEIQKDVDLNPGITSTLNIVKGRAKRGNVQLNAELSPLPGIACRPSKINQVILNLVANAIDACPSGGTVTVRTTPAPDGGVEIRVIDTGPGIPPHIREKIFDPFFTTKPQGQGTGLGLSISHGIVAEHGGRIDVESEPGKGATFIVWLPGKKS